MRSSLLIFLATFVAGADAHGAMTQPKSRNAIDGQVAPWNGSVPESVPFMFWCAAPDSSSSDPRKVSGAHGQACFFGVKLLLGDRPVFVEGGDP